MAAGKPISLSAMNLDGVGLQVEFLWRQDRHCHTIGLVVDNSPISVFESMEGSSLEDWPPSPPLQQLSVEELRPKTQVALLVGMAGKSHYSISVEPAHDRTKFVFDVACRSREIAEQLGSEYLLLAGGVSSASDHDAIIDVDRRLIQLSCDRDGETASRIIVNPKGVRIEPALVVSLGTTRWRYSLELS